MGEGGARGGEYCGGEYCGLAAPAAPQLALRKKMTEQLIIEESKHEALEEMYFWPVVRDHLPDGDTLADQSASAPPG